LGGKESQEGKGKGGNWNGSRFQALGHIIVSQGGNNKQTLNKLGGGSPEGGKPKSPEGAEGEFPFGKNRVPGSSGIKPRGWGTPAWGFESREIG